MEKREMTPQTTRVDEIVANIQREIRNLFKNAPVSAKNAARHRCAAYDLREAAKAIERRVEMKLSQTAAKAKDKRP